MAFGLSAGAISLIGMGAGALAGSKGGTKSETQEPWAPAQPWMMNNLKTGQDLQNYYQQNPFNQQQQTSYSNLFGDLDNFRNNTAPGLMSFANNAMNSGGYQRQQLSAPGTGGYNRQSTNPQTTGQSAQQQQQQTRSGPFSVNPGQSYGLLDLASQNPFTNGGIKAAATPVNQAQQGLTPEQLAAYQKLLAYGWGGGGDGSGAGTGTGTGDGGIGGGSVW